MSVLAAQVRLLTARGELAEAIVLADQLASLIAATADEFRLVVPPSEAVAENALWTGRPETAREKIARGWARVRDRADFESVGRLCWLGVRAEADLAKRGSMSIVSGSPS